MQQFVAYRPIDAKCSMSLGYKTVLIVDPDADIRELLLTALTLEGVKVETASTGVAALQMLYRTGIDLLIVEAELPDVKTGTVIDRIKHSPKQIPIIVIAANRSEAFEKVLREKGVFTYITKPFSLELLKIAVRDALASRSKTTNGGGQKDIS
ncbi:MAG: response regulator [Planctomycetota bacterium]|nr:MAG: response regulator [Planctomycetota bacterium]